MKKILLICNTVLYAILYHLSLFYVGCRFGFNYAFCVRLHDGKWVGLEYLWQYFFYPVAFFFLFFAGVSYYRNRENFSAKSVAIFGVAQFAPFAVNWILSLTNNHANDPILKLILMICSAVILVNCLICAVITYREDKAIKYKSYSNQE